MLLFVLVVNALYIQVNADGCEITLDPKRGALVLYPNSLQLVYPLPGEKVIHLKTSEVVQMACPGTVVLVDGISTEQIVVDATCTSDERFRIKDNLYVWSQISCQGATKSIARDTDQYCENNARIVHVGFDLGGGRFVKIMLICFHFKKLAALYSAYNLTASIGSGVRGTSRPYFYQDENFYDLGYQKVDNLYKRGQQRKNINRLLGLSEKKTRYIKNGGLFFLSRGHLTAKMDFVYPAQQNTTFRFINAAPQWQSLNGRNWNSLEINTRNYAAKNAVNLLVWTGTYKVATLPHKISRKNIPLYLYSNRERRAIPVPAFYWKMIYNPDSNRGIVVVGINNPYKKNVEEDIICPDVSNNTRSWFSNLNRENHTDGYMYACTIPEFANVVQYAPKFDTYDLLV